MRTKTYGLCSITESVWCSMRWFCTFTGRSSDVQFYRYQFHIHLKNIAIASNSLINQIHQVIDVHCSFGWQFVGSDGVREVWRLLCRVLLWLKVRQKVFNYTVMASLALIYLKFNFHSNVTFLWSFNIVIVFFEIFSGFTLRITATLLVIFLHILFLSVVVNTICINLFEYIKNL